MYGIDISNYQANLDLSKVKPDFVIIKATEGTGYVSPSCDKQYQAAKLLDIPRGVYHFARNSSNTAQAEADYFVSQIKGYVGDALLVLDWEDVAGDLGDTVWARKWLDRVCALTGVKPLIYMSASVCRGADWSQVVAGDYGLWVAAYGANNGQQNAKPSIKYWPTYALWQYTSVGKLAGYSGNLDLNEFYGDRAAWDKYAGKNTNSDTPGGIPKNTTSKESEATMTKNELAYLGVDNWTQARAKLTAHLGETEGKCQWGQETDGGGGYLGEERRNRVELQTQLTKTRIELEETKNNLLLAEEAVASGEETIKEIQKANKEFVQLNDDLTKTNEMLQERVNILQNRIDDSTAQPVSLWELLVARLKEILR